MSSKNTSFRERKFHCNGLVLDFSSPLVMGIVNLTPDSFYADSRLQHEKAVIKRVEEMLEDGAGLIDLGALSTRPGAKDISIEEERNRLRGPLKQLLRVFPQAIFSIDTYRSEVARECVEAGAHLVNDISGGQFDEKMFETVAGLKVPYILMHLHGRPESMQNNPLKKGAVGIVRNYFAGKVAQLRALGVEDIILDPGFGFGKSLESNYALLKELESVRVGGLPLLAGLSRKSMLNRVLDIGPEEALNGTTVLHTIALLKGANILRVHDVKEAVEAVKLTGYFINAADSA